LPADNSDCPLLVYLHGGAWITGSKDEYASMGERLARLGVSTAIVDYRLSTNDCVCHPDHVDDCSMAISWLAANRFSWNPNRVFIAGHSAGAHMAALIAADSDIQAAGFIGIAGIYDLPALADRFPDYRERFMRQAFGSAEQNWHDASPINRPISSVSPWLLIHSATDELVDPGQSEQFCTHLKNEGAQAQFIMLLDGPHYEAAQSIGQPGPVTDLILQFVSQRGDQSDDT
jgi:acetyl esterase/lipase